MQRQEYEQLCAECDCILREEGASDLAVMSTSWLHVLNEHPANTMKYEAAPSVLAIALLRFASTTLGRIFLAVVRHRRRVPLASEARSRVLVFSHLVNLGHLKLASDFYFGLLPQQLAASGKPTVVAMLNHTGAAVRDVAPDPAVPAQQRVVLDLLLAPREEAAIARDQWRAFRKLRRPRAGVRPCTSVRAALDALGGSTAANIRFHRQSLALARRLLPDTVVATYEGHAWERLAFHAARQANPRVRCIGYQHAVVFPLQHGIRRSLGPRLDPDVVVFAGAAGHDWFRERSDFQPRMSVVGTPRHDPEVHDIRGKLGSARAHPSCLLVPDGTVGECLAVFRFGMACAQQMPQIRFVMRLHPVVSLDALRRLEPALGHLPGNLEISAQPIEADFRANAWAIYRGSGAGVRAAMVGLRPLYLDDPQLGMRIDPLSTLGAWRRDVRTAADVESVILGDLSQTPEQVESDYAAARAYLQAYFLEYDLTGFQRVVVEAESQGQTAALAHP
jgi:hypothetical protein